MTKARSQQSNDSRLPMVPGGAGVRFCHACGTKENVGRRKYCSRACRQRLVWKLDVASSLLRALHSRYATFWFTEDMPLFHVVAAGSQEVFSFLWKRTPGKKPADDLGDMVEFLGSQWWMEHEKKNSRHQASLTVLQKARTRVVKRDQVRPHAKATPQVSQRHLSILKLNKQVLLSDKAPEALKSAFRKQVMVHHPDRQGDARLFRKVHESYEDMKHWLENPVMRHKKGLPDKWCYDGRKWSPPTQTQHTGP